MERPPDDTLSFGQHTFAWGSKTYIMAILNATPNSFSGDGLIGGSSVDVLEDAVKQARKAMDEGADIIDIGGVPTFPGAPYVSVEEEIQRITPIIRAVSQATSLPISVDSSRAEAVLCAIDAGASIVNSAWGLHHSDGTWNKDLAQLVAARSIPFVLTHNKQATAAQGSIGGYYPTVEYNDVLTEVIDDLRASVIYAESWGIPRNLLIIDPGLGLGKTPEQNLLLLRHLSELRNIGIPMMIAASRKSFIGFVLHVPPEERDLGTAATTVLAIKSGADIVRVHNVLLNYQVAKMADALIR